MCKEIQGEKRKINFNQRRNEEREKIQEGATNIKKKKSNVWVMQCMGNPVAL